MILLVLLVFAINVVFQFKPVIECTAERNSGIGQLCIVVNETEPLQVICPPSKPCPPAKQCPQTTTPPLSCNKTISANDDDHNKLITARPREILLLAWTKYVSHVYPEIHICVIPLGIFSNFHLIM